MSVLRLATKWKMLEFRRIAIEKLSSSSLPPLERVLLGREQMVPEWVHSGYVDLATREAALSVDEFKSLGLQTALVMSQNLRRCHAVPGAKRLASEDSPFNQAISDTFKTELHEEAVSLPAIDRILLARSYGVSEWLYTGLVDLGKRQEDITLEEAEKLGLETTVNLCQVRERLRTDKSASDPVFCFDRPAFTFDPSIRAAREIDALFEEELKGVRAAAIPYGHHNPQQYDPPQMTKCCGSDRSSSPSEREGEKEKKRSQGTVRVINRGRARGRQKS